MRDSRKDFEFWEGTELRKAFDALMATGARLDLDLFAGPGGLELARLRRSLDPFGDAKRRMCVWPIFRLLVLSVHLPNRQRTRVITAFQELMHGKPGITERRRFVVDALRYGDLEIARALLQEAHSAFEKLSDAALEAALKQSAGNARGGATRVGAVTIAAALSLRVEAFGDRRRDGESPRDARTRVAETYKRALVRARR